jgi:hypothetical protein
MCPPDCNSGVPVRVWAVRRDILVSLVPRIVGVIPTWRKMGTVWSVYTLFVLFGFSWGMHCSMCLGLPCKVINQSIVGLSPLSETA